MNYLIFVRHFFTVIFIFFISSCDNQDTIQPEKNFLTDTNSQDGQYFITQVKPIIDNRCVVCHGCYDAPCQLKLSSVEGILRGANQRKIYNGTRLTADPLTRLHEDALTTEAWREKEFYPVVQKATTEQQGNINSQQEETQSNKSVNGLLSSFIQLKHDAKETFQDNGLLDEEQFDLSLNREQVCTLQDEFDDFAESHPQWGMPFAMTPLANSEYETLTNWLENGAFMSHKPPLSAEYKESIKLWEDFFNGDSYKQQLVARYIYEHLFLANIYFSEISNKEYFKLVRSTTPPGKPIEIIATRRPFDSPSKDPRITAQKTRVYYRLQRVKDTIVAKQHIPYPFNSEQMARYKSLFFKADYKVNELPGYQENLASNPFATFAALPTESRYRFMLEQSKFTIRGFMKGAVCRGQIALNVINDHFWVVFANPDEPVFKEFNANISQHIDKLDLPAELSSNAGILAYWTKYSEAQKNYLQFKGKFFKSHNKNKGSSLNWIWQGDGKNPNASLTVFRHFDSASVVKGLVGTPPKTAWLIDYPILERIHYLLVAGFDVYGNVGHQLTTRTYMDFLRMESEFNFLTLLPEKDRSILRDQWYRGASEDVKKYVYGQYAYFDAAPEIEYSPKEAALNTLYKKLKQHLRKVLPEKHLLAQSRPPQIAKQLETIQGMSGTAANILPELGLLVINRDEKNLVFSIIRNSAHSNVTSLLLEDSNRLPEEDYITVIPGVIGAYPDAFWQVDDKNLQQFLQQMTKLRKESDYTHLMNQYGIRRTHSNFWQFSDKLHQLYKETQPIEYGLFDFNRIENR